MRKLVDALESLPWIVRLLLVIFIDCYGDLIRIGKSAARKNVVGVILAVILLLTGGLVIFWIIDLICVILNKPIWWIDK